MLGPDNLEETTLELASENETEGARGREFLVEGTAGPKEWRGRQGPYPTCHVVGAGVSFKLSGKRWVSLKQRSDVIQPSVGGVAWNQAGVEAGARWAAGATACERPGLGQRAQEPWSE